MNPLASGLLQVAVAVVMLGLGAGLPLSALRALAASRNTLAATLLIELVVMPALALPLGALCGLDGALALGLVLLAACPSGPLGSAFTSLARGDVALSLGLTSMGTLLSLATLPAVLLLALGRTAPEALSATPGPGLLLLITLPAGLGVLLRARWPQLAERLVRATRGLTGLLLVGAVLAIASKRNAELLTTLPRVALAALLFDLLQLGVGWALGGGLARRERASALALGLSVRNGTVALAVAATPGLEDGATLALPTMVYAGIQSLTTALFTGWNARRAARPG